MNRSFWIAIVAVCGLAACGSNEEPAAETPTEPAAAAPTAAAEPAAPAAPATPTPPPATGGGGATITLGTGFSPDPTIATGTSGGAREAATLSSDCAGWVSASPDHVLELSAEMPSLRIMAYGTEEDSDVTLVVRKPDGTYLCNDDSDGFHPMVEGAMPQGRYEIFVGSYEEGRHQAYRLGITTQADATPSSALAQQ